MVMVPATTGVDLNEDKLRLQPGTLRDCLNFECAYRSGYSRAEGMFRFDGRDLLEDMSVYRSLVQEAPGGPAYGLHFFTDRFNDQSWLYAVVESTRIALASRGVAVEDLETGTQRIEIYANDETPTGFPNAWVMEANASFAGETRDLIEVLFDDSVDVFSGSIVAYTRVLFENGEELPVAGDQIEDPVSGWTATVRGATLISGSAMTLDISAELWVEIDTPASIGVGAIVERVSDSQVIGRVTLVDGFSDNGVLVGDDISLISDFGSEVNRGVLIRSGERGWEVVQQSYDAQFRNGTNEPSNVYTNGSQVALGAPPTALPNESANSAFWNPTSAVDWDLDDSDMRDAIQSDDSSFVEATLVDENDLTEQIRLSNFGTTLDPLDEVTGIEFEIICEKFSGTMDVEINAMRSQDGAVRGTGEVVDTKDTIVLGGPNDLWGANSVNDLRQNVLNPNYTWYLDFIGKSNDDDSVVRVYMVRRTVYLREGSLESVVYLRSGGQDVEARAIYVNRTEGEWDNNDAKGFITLARISNPASVAANAQIRTAPSGGGDLIAILDGSLTPIRLPSRERMQIKKSQFEFIDTNFFASGRFRAVYGVSGAGHAFTFNNNYLFYIRTGRAEDEPRHIARHKERLVLGYENGDADFSVNANPDLFDGILNAFTLGFGDRITGMLPLDGETLGVWTDKSIFGVQGTNIEDVIQQVIAPEAGAIEYTVRDAGQPVFTDEQGTATVSSSATYGDFAAGSLSKAIRPWLRPRLQANAAAGIRPIRAEAVPKKNQYRLWFEDGYVATLTLDVQEPPKWTFQRPYLNAEQDPLTLLATTYGLDENFKPRSFASFDESRYVQETHAGSDFDGQVIAASMTFNPVHANGAGKRVRVKTIHVHGICTGLVQLNTKIGVDYVLPEETNYVGVTNMGDASQTEQEPVFAKVRHAAAGRDFALQIETASVNDHTIQVLEYPNLSERRLER